MGVTEGEPVNTADAGRRRQLTQDEFAPERPAPAQTIVALESSFI